MCRLAHAAGQRNWSTSGLSHALASHELIMAYACGMLDFASAPVNLTRCWATLPDDSLGIHMQYFEAPFPNHHV